jgi:hypothetical protein
MLSLQTSRTTIRAPRRLVVDVYGDVFDALFLSQSEFDIKRSVLL